MIKSFQHSVQKSRAGDICFITTQDPKGQDVHYFVLLKKGMEQYLKKQVKVLGPLDLGKFGTVLASNFGHMPQASTLLMLEEKYQYRFQKSA